MFLAYVIFGLFCYDSFQVCYEYYRRPSPYLAEGTFTSKPSIRFVLFCQEISREGLHRCRGRLGLPPAVARQKSRSPCGQRLLFQGPELAERVPDMGGLWNLKGFDADLLPSSLPMSLATRV